MVPGSIVQARNPQVQRSRGKHGRNREGDTHRGTEGQALCTDPTHTHRGSSPRAHCKSQGKKESPPLAEFCFSVVRRGSPHTVGAPPGSPTSGEVLTSLAEECCAHPRPAGEGGEAEAPSGGWGWWEVQERHLGWVRSR